MNNATLQALKDSIEHWYDNLNATETHHASVAGASCPLCIKFARASENNSCDGCPVAEAGHRGCLVTPYEAAYRAHKAWCREPNDRVAQLKFGQAARAEIEFLESLLPKGGVE
jgi:hypothetical protein